MPSSPSNLPLRLVLISSRPEDKSAFEEIASLASAELHLCENWNKLIELITAYSEPIIIWDADEPGADAAEHPRATLSIRDILRRECAPSRVCVLTTESANKFPVLIEPVMLPTKQEGLVFQHNLLRRYSLGTSAIYARLLSAIRGSQTTRLKDYFPADTKVRSITLKHSDHRKTAVEAINNILEKDGISNRIASKVAQAVDELLMNAIFDAPRDRSGRQIRQHTERKSSFELLPGEVVELEVASTANYSGICVTDHFGSADPHAILKFVNQNFEEKDYQLRKFSQGAGLGLYGIVQSGLSYLIDIQPKAESRATLFFPNTTSYKDFKSGFHFTSCITRTLSAKSK